MVAGRFSNCGQSRTPTELSHFAEMICSARRAIDSRLDSIANHYKLDDWYNVNGHFPSHLLYERCRCVGTGKQLAYNREE